MFPSQLLGAHIDRRVVYNVLSATLLAHSSLLYTMEVSCRKNVFMHYHEISRKSVVVHLSKRIHGENVSRMLVGNK